IGASILRDQPKPLPANGQVVPPELAAILAHGLSKDRTRRFQSAIEFMRALGSLQRSQPVATVQFSASGAQEPVLEDEATTNITWRRAFEEARDAEQGDDEDATTNITTPRGLKLPAHASSSDTTQNHRTIRGPLPAPNLPRLYTVPPASRVPFSPK